MWDNWKWSVSSTGAMSSVDCRQYRCHEASAVSAVQVAFACKLSVIGIEWQAWMACQRSDAGLNRPITLFVWRRFLFLVRRTHIQIMVAFFKTPCISPVIDNGIMILTGQNRSGGCVICLSATSSTTNPTDRSTDAHNLIVYLLTNRTTT